MAVRASRRTARRRVPLVPRGWRLLITRRPAFLLVLPMEGTPTFHALVANNEEYARLRDWVRSHEDLALLIDYFDAVASDWHLK